MLEYLKEESNKTITENFAASYKSTLSDCLDLFATVGALRNAVMMKFQIASFVPLLRIKTWP